MIYLDSSALLKLLHDEAESAALADWLTARTGTPLVSSALAKVEVVRACRRINPATSALSIQAELTAFVAYDQRLAEAASTAGLELLAPGA